MKSVKYKFAVGKPVYVVARRYVRTTEPCDFCEGTGSFNRNDGKPVPCPVCFGVGTKPISQSGRMVEVAERDIVESVSITVYKEYSVRTYILEKNGYKREELLFATEKEAEDSFLTKDGAVGYSGYSGGGSLSFGGSMSDYFFNQN